jgi:pilus assembly protein CpaD
MFKRSTLLLAFAAPTFALAGCDGASVGGTTNRGLESVHQPVVERTDLVFDLRTGPGGLAPGESARLADWFAAMHLGYGDQITVDDPTGGARTRSQVSAVIAPYGLLLSNEPPMSAPPAAPGTAQVVVSRMRASVPGCPDFTRYGGSEFESNTNSNHGCAINSNLASMIANPADLVRGEPGAPVYDAAQGTKAVNIYRSAAPTGAGGTAVKAEGTGGK